MVLGSASRQKETAIRRAAGAIADLVLPHRLYGSRTIRVKGRFAVSGARQGDDPMDVAYSGAAAETRRFKGRFTVRGGCNGMTIDPARFLLNGYCAEKASFEPFGREAIRFHRRLPGYRETPLSRLEAAERELGVRAVWVKDESDRFGLPAFKVLGASWAVYRKIVAEHGIPDEGWWSLDQLKELVLRPPRLELVTATDGNHGRGVARVAAWFGLGARVYMPAGSAEARVEAIRSEGAEVIVVDGDYDEAVERAAREAGAHAWLVQDTAWPGYEEIPSWIVEGYSTIGHEVDEALARAGESDPDLVVVQIGVGSLAAAIVRHYKHAGRSAAPRVLGVEASGAACALESIRAGERRSAWGPHRSVMAGLNCGTLSSIAWPVIRDGIEALTVIDDEAAFRAMRILAGGGIASGESGAAGLAALLETAAMDRSILGESLGLGPRSSVLVISTEGVTDPELYRRVVGR
jgi:diaminopropionate ammonia-lyase